MPGPRQSPCRCRWPCAIFTRRVRSCPGKSPSGRASGRCQFKTLQKWEEVMVAKVTVASLGALLAASALSGHPAVAESFVEHSSEVRMQLDFVVPNAALAKFLPEGFTPNVATQGAAKDCNVRMIF